MSNCAHPAWLEIDLDAVAHNVTQLKKAIGDQRELMAIVKADSYGHGAVPVSLTALENGATWLGVNLYQEGLELRAAGITAPILILGCSSFANCCEIIQHDLTVVIADDTPLNALAEAAQKLGKQAPVQIKVDTGMARLGAQPADIEQLSQAVVDNPSLQLTGILSHFPIADMADKSFTVKQIDIFQTILDKLLRHGISPPHVHIANSAGVLDLPDYPGNMTRTGITIYGLYPSAEVDHSIKIRPALSFKAKVSCVKKVPAGTGVSYGLTYTTTSETSLAIIPAGYAHGLPRGLSNKGEVLIKGTRYPIRGRVCMDSTIIEVGSSDVKTGDEVVLIGRQGDEHIPAEEWAYLMNTINYEIVTALSSRLPRLYLKNGKISQGRDLIFSYHDC